MNIEVYATGHAHDKDIDKFIYALMSGKFNSYQSSYFDYEEVKDQTKCPNVLVDVREKVELDPFQIAMKIFQGVTKILDTGEDIEVKVNDALVVSVNASFEPFLTD